MRYETSYTEEELVATRALRFANLTGVRDESKKEEWAEKVKRMTGVVGSKSRYSFTPHGRVIEDEESALSYQTAVRCHNKLRNILDDILKEKNLIPSHSIWMNRRKITIDFGASPDIWIRHFVRGDQIKPTTQRAMTPTLTAFVAYAGALLSQDPRRRRLAKCEQCGHYFLMLPRKGGPKRKTCSERCREKRKRVQNANRQRRFRAYGSIGL